MTDRQRICQPAAGTEYCAPRLPSLTMPLPPLLAHLPTGLLTGLLAATALLLVLGGLRLLWRRRQRRYPYQMRPALVTAAELRFLRVLEQAVGGRYRIHAQVRLADLLQVRSIGRRRMAAQNRINCKHVDFVLCEPDTLAIVCAIELDDRSHLLPARQARDHFLNEACKAAGLPLLRFAVQRSYALAEIRQALDTLERRR